MNDDLTELASAYLDGELDADARAVVDADPDLLAEVDDLRQVRALLGDAAPAPISVREAQLASALDAWERLPDAERTGARRDATPRGIDPATAAAAATIATPPPTSLGDRRRSRSARWLLPAAAGLIVVFAGGVALQTLGGNDDNDSADGAAEVLSEADASREPDSSSALADEAAEELQRDLDGGATDDAAEGGSEAVIAEINPDIATDTGVDTGIDSEAPPADSGLELLETPEELASFASDAIGAPSSPVLTESTDAEESPAGDDSAESESGAATGEADGTTFELPTCPGIDIIVGPASYQGRSVIIGIDESRNLAIAHDPLDCVEVVRATLP